MTDEEKKEKLEQFDQIPQDYDLLEGYDHYYMYFLFSDAIRFTRPMLAVKGMHFSSSTFQLLI